MRHALAGASSSCCDAEAAAARLRLQHWRHEAVRLSCLYNHTKPNSISLLLNGNRAKSCLQHEPAATKRRRTNTTSSGCECTPANESPLLLQLEADATAWRKEVGRLSCLHESRGPTGGFCMLPGSKFVPNVGDHAIAAQLVPLFRNASVLDLGAGVGTYGSYFRDHAPSVRWTGIDGSEGIEEATSGLVQWADLADSGLPRALRRPWDWTFSSQVAEHVPPAAEAAFMHTLVVHATVGVVLSWAALGQQGLMHVNNQPLKYVQCMMRFLGFDADPRAERDISGTVFRKRAAAPALPTAPTPDFVQSYRAARDGCGFTTWGYLSLQPRSIRRLAARRAVLGLPMTRQACGANASEAKATEALRLRLPTTLDEDAIRALEVELFEALVLDEVRQSHRAELRALSKRVDEHSSGEAWAAEAALRVPMRAHNASMATWHRWLSNTIWGLCVPPSRGFCFYSRTPARRRANAGDACVL